MTLPFQHLLYITFFLVTFLVGTLPWQQWNYETQWSADSAQVNDVENAWHKIWGYSAPAGYQDTLQAPRPRRGHSLVHIVTPEDSMYNGDTYLVMFGGRDNNAQAVHIPKTYGVKTINGSLEFTTYDEKPVSPCNDPEGKYYSKAERQNCGNATANATYALINVGVFYNDVWAYRLCPKNGTTHRRYFDAACIDEGWVLWHPGAREGGCVLKLGELECSVPSERWNHGAVMHNDGAMYVYGGFSQRCGDYCDDLWMFDIFMQNWREVYRAGELSKLYFETWNGFQYPYTVADVPIDNSTAKNAGPGKRWRHSMAIGTPYEGINPITGMNATVQMTAIFGGHRLWQGFAKDNSQGNNWKNSDEIPDGGYLDDLWIYTKVLDFSTFHGDFRKYIGRWKNFRAKDFCFANPGSSWASRFDVTCSTTWPQMRAGHSSIVDSKRGLIWIFGGFRTYYPYLSTDGEGSGPGTSSVGTGGFVPYPGYNYFLDDLWQFSMETENWVQMTYPSWMNVPSARADSVFLLMGDIIFLHGGYSDQQLFDDTWYYNITSNIWLQKKKFVHPIYPVNCTDDIEYINKTANCTNMLWTKHLDRDTVYPFDVLPYSEQKFYWPDTVYGPYYGIVPKGFSSVHDRVYKPNEPPAGTPVFPYAATGPIQYARKFVYEWNSTHNGTIVESCTSVKGEPTRGKVLDGMAGRSNSSIFITQPRRQRPAWDGCRDRADGRTDLPNELQYVTPSARYGHKATYVEHTNELIMYGGSAYLIEEVTSLTQSYYTIARDDMWYFNTYYCINNCSNSGDCFYGYCFCWEGYYGEDCSNSSCPGTFCSYNQYTLEQQCVHACSAGYTHTDNDAYVQDIAKLPCSTEVPGESNGICDGFGTVQCAPPFVGDDCGTKDCPANCSFNGWCSIEYPVSRCMCQPGYYGLICDKKVCLNNCTYPNGVCNDTTGQCDCRMMYSPYNNTREYKPWAGEDCSYLFPYSAGCHSARVSWLLLMALGVFVIIAADGFGVQELFLRDGFDSCEEYTHSREDILPVPQQHCRLDTIEQSDRRSNELLSTASE